MEEAARHRHLEPATRASADAPPQQQKPRCRHLSTNHSVKSASASSHQHRTAAPRVRAKRSRNPSRERLQSELKHLRDLCDELEQQLEDLQQEQQGERSQRHEEKLALSTAWEYIAKCQQHKRTQAEEENAQLRAHVQSQLVILKNLHQARAAVSGLLDQVSSGRRFGLSLGFPQRSSIEQDDVAIYATLSSEADAAFFSMESVFEANGLSTWRFKNSSALWTQAPVKTQSSSDSVSGSHCIEITDVDVLPFAKESVLRTMWQCWEQQYEAKNCVVYELPNTLSRSRDSLAGRMRYDEYVDGERAPLEILFVLKLFVECDRIWYVWRSMSTFGISVAEIVVKETWWEELRTVPAQDGAVEGTLTLSCSQMESKTIVKSSSPCSESAADAIAAPLLTSVLISSYEADVVDVTCRMMDLLLEETDSVSVP